jgi:hypothetical protein
MTFTKKLISLFRFCREKPCASLCPCKTLSRALARHPWASFLCVCGRFHLYTLEQITRHRFSNLYTSPRWNNTAPRALSLGVYRKSDNPLVCAARGFLAVTNSQSYEGFDAMRDRLLTFVGNSRCSDGHRCYSDHNKKWSKNKRETIIHDGWSN